MRSILTGALIAICSVACGQGKPKASPESAANSPPSGNATEGTKAAPGNATGRVEPGQPGQPERTGAQANPNRTTENNSQPGQGAPRQGNNDRERGQNVSGDRNSASTGDQQIAALLACCNHNEIEIAKFAEPKLQSPAAKEFAARMIKEHTPCCEKLQTKAGNSAHATPSTGTANPAGNNANRSANSSASQTGGAPNWVQIHQEMGEHCLAKTQQELTTAEGPEFDKCFIGQQIGCHMEMLAKLETLRNHVSADLRQDIEEGIKMATTHLQQAKQIKDQLK